jgi:predicted flap endonuclease-1-like 5' DNA nuclease
MTLLFRVVYAAHANGTHHKLALDALRDLTEPVAENWRRLFLAHAKLFLDGAKAPDTQFKDFKNHVLHVRDDYWGGAPEKARNWYGHLVRALQESNWEEAVWCAGVLSHYVTDPIHPFHTAQSQAENNIHRAVEWSISRSYDDLRTIGLQGWSEGPITVPEGPNWLAELVCRGADRANVSYEALIAHYDFRRGVVDPPAGLDDVAKRLVGDLIVYAGRSVAAVLDRALTEAAVVPPDVNLTLETLVATLGIPVKMVTKRLAAAAERRLVERMYDELQATGTVEKNLPEDDRMVRDLYQKEVAAKRTTPSVEARFPLPAPRAKKVAAMAPAPAAMAQVSRSMTPRAPIVSPLAPAEMAEPQSRRSAASVPVVAPKRIETPPETAAAAPAAAASPPRPASVPSIAPVDAAARQASLARRLDEVQATTPKPANDARRLHLRPQDEIVAAPSIGPKTAERLIKVGITTVADLLAADPGALAEALDTAHIRARTIADWQHQARLVCTLPGLRGTHAQILVGAGFQTVERIARADVNELMASVLRFCRSSEGERVLRNGDVPDMEKIKAWFEEAVAQQKAA